MPATSSRKPSNRTSAPGRAVAARPNAVVRPDRLRCEYAVDPLGVDTRAPRFSWITDHPQRNQRQTAYQILVAGDAVKLRPGKADVWDSGAVKSSQSVNVEFAGKALRSGQRCFWIVRIKDAQGNDSQWSEPASFEIGLLDKSDWCGEWIGLPNPVRGVAPLFRRAFSLSKRVRRARAHICGIGYHELRINGAKVGDHVLDPGNTDYSKRSLYVTHDITDFLRQGTNALGVMLGEGWYGNDALAKTFPQRNPRWLGTPRFILQVNIELADGTSVSIVSDTSRAWLCCAGPIVENGVYNGETYDARLEKSDWDTPSYRATPAHGWTRVAAAASPGGVLVSQMLEPIKVIRSLRPSKLTNPREGVYVYDIGQNLAGWARLTVEGPRGTTVVMRFSEVMGDDGLVNQENLRTAKATDTYILKGEGIETYEPRFTYHGFRYVQIEGFPGVPGLDAIEVQQVRSSLEQSSRFSSGNALINRIQDAVLWTEESNLHAAPTDCPQRDERMGWLNDATVRVEETLYNFDAVRLLTKWEDDISDTQDPTTGMISDTAPACFTLIPGEAVNCSYLLIPWNLYVQCGDTRVLARHYDGLRAWNAFVGSKVENGVVAYSNYGDWASPAAEIKAGTLAQSANTPGTLMSTGYYYYNTVTLAKMAMVLGKPDDAQTFNEQATRIAEAFNRAFFDAKAVRYAKGSQGSNVFPLYLGLAPTDARKAIVKDILRDLKAHDDHLTTGNLCTRYIMEILAEEGYVDVAFRLATQTTYPSWGFMLGSGATTIWERWEKATGGGMNSHNHPMYASISLWFIKYLAGISPDPEAPAYERIVIKPYLPTNLPFVDASIQTVRGPVSSSWKRIDGGVAMQVVIPFNSTARVFVPRASSEAVIRESGRVAWGPGASCVRGIGKGEEAGEYVVFEVGSGTYSFVATAG